MLDNQLLRAPKYAYTYSNETNDTRQLHRTISASETLDSLRLVVEVRFLPARYELNMSLIFA